MYNIKSKVKLFFIFIFFFKNHTLKNLIHLSFEIAQQHEFCANTIESDSYNSSDHLLSIYE